MEPQLPSRAELAQLLTDLYALELQHATEPGLIARSSSLAPIRRQVDCFRSYASALRLGRILDWGCRQGTVSCMLRKTFEETVEIEGCDIARGEYPTFWGYAGLRYTRLMDPVALPYPDGHFDSVIGNGVLEHVMSPERSLRELARVLKPRGRLVIAFLPNRYSYTECMNRKLGDTHHQRLYNRPQARLMLESAGFDTLWVRHHQVAPSFISRGGGSALKRPVVRRAVGSAYALNTILERLWPVNLMAANIMLAAEKSGGRSRSDDTLSPATSFKAIQP